MKVSPHVPSPPTMDVQATAGATSNSHPAPADSFNEYWVESCRKAYLRRWYDEHGDDK